MNYKSDFIIGTNAKLKRAWLLTWEWIGNHALIRDKFAAVISSRCSDNTIEKILELYYVSSYLSLHEQFAYVKSNKHCPYKVQHNTIAVPERMQKECSLLPQVPFADSMIIGENPWLWARLVCDLETWIDENNVEYLRWRERENISLDEGKIKSDWRECFLKR